MENDSLEKAIYLAINQIRKVQHKRPHSVNIVEAVAGKCGLSESKVKEHLDHLVETGAVFINVTEKGNSYFIFDPKNIGEGENGSHDLLKDDLSSGWNFENSQKLSETKVGLSTETIDIHTPTNQQDNET